MNGVKRSVVWGLVVVFTLAFASLATAAGPNLTVAASFTYPQGSSGTAWICVRVAAPAKTTVTVTVTGTVLGAKKKTVKVGAKGVIMVRFKTNTPAGYDFVVTGKLGSSAKTTKRATVNVPQPGADAKQGTFSCV